MTLSIKSPIFRGLFLLIAIGVFLLLVAWIASSYIATRLADEGTVRSLELATRLDPYYPEYHLTLGRLYEYVPESMHPQKATEQFRRAAQLDPYNPNVWVNLAAVSEFHGDVAQASKYLQDADFLAPHLPMFQWSIGNFYLMHGSSLEAFKHFKVILTGTRQYDNLIFRLAWKASGNADEILQDLIPDSQDAEFSYLNYLVDQNLYDDTTPVWNRIISGGSSFSPQDVAKYINGLLRAHEPTKAYQVWTDLEKKGILQYAAPEPSENLVTNGRFEDPLLDLGFGWRTVTVDDAYSGLDTSHFHSPGHAMLVGFDGKANLYYGFVFQYIKVQPATSYRLRAFVMTEGITTDSGPRLEVRDAYDPKALDQMTPNMIGTSNGWVPLLLDFKTGPKTQLLVLSVLRLRSRMLDNQIAGKFWLDDVSLTPLKK